MTYRQHQMSVYPSIAQKKQLDRIKGLAPSALGSTNTDIIFHSLTLVEKYLEGELEFKDKDREVAFASSGNCFPFIKQMYKNLKETTNATNTIQDQQDGESAVVENVDGGKHSCF